MSLQMPERCYCADVVYPMAVVATAERGLIVYQLENQPSEFRRIDSPLKHQRSSGTRWLSHTDTRPFAPGIAYVYRGGKYVTKLRLTKSATFLLRQIIVGILAAASFEPQFNKTWVRIFM
ncbi:mRNA export factor [Larimichthys crocea]|uniref:Uncharacterized protein n=1 Tax=Larimichthys crocea TaxID=215358 RepID=A0ACD3RJ68_LARCR|nr:mRNA export factor [Larimichthys crocea]